ncbi:MAG: N-acetyl-alpha-D-glucosaminyl L-malate synthase BshA [Bacillota bacterium]|nr:N-acetyl-alpha-D-glucosaminyl L-malate synthase BshA [Bacillota bacterium]
MKAPVDQPLRIAMVGYPTPGGSGVVAAELAHALVERGHRVHMFSHDVPLRLRTGLRGLSYHPIEVPDYPVLLARPYEMALAGTLVGALSEEPCHIIHVHYGVPHAPSAYLAKEILGPKGPPLVVTLHGSDVRILGRDPALGMVLRFALERAQAVTTVSAALAEAAREVLALRGPIDVIPNFIDIERQCTPAELHVRNQWARPGEALLLHASNFRPIKRVRDVIKIFALVARELPARLLLVGEGPEAPAAYQEAVTQGVVERVAFLGVQSDVSPYMSVADLFLLPSEEESFGLSALEAMACGVPVVGSRVGGIPEVVEEGRSGFLFPVGDVEGMARGALAILKNPALHQEMSRAAAQRARDHFHVSKVIPLYEALYRRLTAQR